MHCGFAVIRSLAFCTAVSSTALASVSLVSASAMVAKADAVVSAAGTSSAAANAPTAHTTEVHLSLRRREIALVHNGVAQRRWPVVIGAPATPTPVGRFAVTSKVVNPIYQSTSTGKVKGVGPLGNRWIGFHRRGVNDFGIHGTPWPWWVDARAAVSLGCVRMRNEHVEQLFAAVDLGTPVIIQP